MLYCPKCRSTYEEGTQRFCSNDGGRLLPATPKSDSATPSGGVFTSILGKLPNKNAGDKLPVSKSVIKPNFEQPTTPEPAKPHMPISKIYEAQRQIEQAPIAFDDEDSLLELDFDIALDAPAAKNAIPDEKIAAPIPEAVVTEKREPPRPQPKPVNIYEIPSGTAEIGDRSAKPAGRLALSWETPSVLVGQTVKGRYVIKELMGDDEDSLEYLAEDQINEAKRAVVRVYMDDEAYQQHFAEERISLAHLNHPNISAVFDSGELPEGFRFVVSEYVDGQSLSAALRASGQFNTKRAARVIRQVSYALSEAHENGILHRNLKPENIMLTVTEAGIEQVKLVNFGLSNRYWNESDLVYKSPEEVRDEAATFASEIFSLAVVAYEMLTARLPFNALSERELLNAQERGMAVLPSSLRLDVQALADKILEKAFSFDAPDRYPKARDFGDAFFNALTAVSPWEEQAAITPEAPASVVRSETEPAREFVVVPPIGKPDTVNDVAPVNGDIHIAPDCEIGEEHIEPEVIAPAENDQMWIKRSPELPQTTNWMWGILPIVGAIILLVVLWGLWKMLASRQAENPATANVESQQPLQTPETPGILPKDSELDRRPPARVLKLAPENSRFVNRKEDLTGELAKNFLGFEIHYPAEMKRSESATNFLDIATRSADGIPLEQMIITRYKSRGAMGLDRPNFPKLAGASNADLKERIGTSFRVVGNGETAIQNGRWRGYEVKFEGLLPDGKTRLFGRRIWIPVQSPGVQNGFVITLLATSLADGITGAEDVGTKGKLAVAIENFEPEQNY